MLLIINQHIKKRTRTKEIVLKLNWVNYIISSYAAVCQHCICTLQNSLVLVSRGELSYNRNPICNLNKILGPVFVAHIHCSAKYLHPDLLFTVDCITCKKINCCVFRYSSSLNIKGLLYLPFCKPPFAVVYIKEK
jgi:hypothetical protein